MIPERRDTEDTGEARRHDARTGGRGHGGALSVYGG